MKKRIYIIILYLIFWYLVFVVARILFIVIYHEQAMQAGFSTMAGSFVHGFRLDLSIAAYISLIPVIIVLLSSFTSGKISSFIFQYYTLLASILVSSIVIGDLFLYQYWGFRMDATPLFYMTNLKAATASVSTITVIGGIVLVSVATFVINFIFKKIFIKRISSLEKDPKSMFLILVMLPLLLVIMRGGVGVASLSTSSAYFSQNQFANHTAINPVWNVGLSISESSDLSREYKYFSDRECDSLVKSLYSCDKFPIKKLLTSERPNIILIITESFTAKALSIAGGRSGVMPHMDSLAGVSLFFDHIYAASDRTDKGLAAVLSGYPSLPGSSPLKYQKLTGKLDCIPLELRNSGYDCRFFYGGDLNFANYRSYLQQSGYRYFVTADDFPSDKLSTKWGAYDGDVFEKLISETPDNDSAFFITCLTLTSHEPFQIPETPLLAGNDPESKFLSSLHYTDNAINRFIKKAKSKKWWKNTLIIITADHGSALPGNSGPGSLDKYHIPLIWTGGAVAVSDSIISTVASQTDIAATLLSQLGLTTDKFLFSRNILSPPANPFAFFTFSDGFGIYINNDLLIYNTQTNQYFEKAIGRTILPQKQAKAYMQTIYQDAARKNQ